MGLYTLAALLVSACGDPGFDVTVQVVDSGGTPISDVDVEMDCPPAGLLNYKHHLAFGKTDSAGRVHAARIGEVGLDCWLHAPRYKSDRVNVADCCTKKHPYLGICSRLSTTLHVPTKP